MTDEKISFKIVTEDIVRKNVMNLDCSKATPNGDIPVNILKSAAGSHLPCIANIIICKSKKDIFLMNLSLQRLA